MDTYSSVEDSLIKTRKPYTISKQRERWTEEEHNRFLEALKLYGRAWQRIEEHIGTKTAVQIRSHAQKFFTKLEKEQSLDIDIPPPRPKRKPSNPYPRKTDLGTTSYTQLVDLDNEPSPEKPEGDERTGNGNDTQNENNCSEVLNLFQGASYTSLSSANRNCRSPTMAPGTSRTFREFVPIRKMVHDDTTNNTLNLEKAEGSLEKPIESKKTNEISQSENCGELSSNDMQTTQNYPKHAPVHILKPYFSYTEAAAVSANTQHVDESRSSPFCPTYPSFDPFHTNQDNYQAYLHASSVFSGLIVSSLLQNPAAHTAASFAASFWPCPSIKACADSVSSSLSPSPPSMAAIAAATVSAATAWWTTHGLLPLFPPPLHNSFKINPDAPMRAGDELVSAVINVADKRENELSLQDQQQQLQPECSKLPSMSSSDSEKSEGANQNAGVTESANNEEADNTATADPSNTKSVKQVDRSSCGSNTPSSSEVETDALKMHALEKAEEDLREEQPDDINHPGCDFNNGRGGRSSSYITSESWKEVSEEGRLAFQALFSREVLPQSFWPSNDMRNKGNQTKNMENKNEKVEDATELDLNSNMWGNCCPDNQLTTRNYTILRSESNEKLLQWSMEIGQGKLKARGTGFKPYKRLKTGDFQY